jgi:DNA-binding CsgD family transcriptional regulator
MLRSASLLPIRSELHRRCGRLALAEEDARIALEIIPPGQIYEPYAAGVMALVLIDEDRLEDARQVLEQRGGPSPGTTQVATLARGRLRIAEGDLTRGAAQIVAYGEASHALRDGSPGYWPWRSTVATALARAGQSEEAVELAARELSVAEQVGRDDLRGAPLRALGIATGGDRGIDLLEQAVEVLAGSELALEHLGALLDLGIALRLAGQRSRARAPLRQALDEASRIGAGAIADRAREELLASGARPRRTALVGFEALTPSERRVASLAAQGLTNRQIAQALYVTVKTVEVHLRNSYDKLQITGKRELAAALPDNAVESVAQTA